MAHQLFVSFALGFDIWRQNQNHDASSTMLSLQSTATAMVRALVTTLGHSQLPALWLLRNNQESARLWPVSRVPRALLSLLRLAAKRGNPDRSSTPTAGLEPGDFRF